jgi:hypothetical protein
MTETSNAEIGNQVLASFMSKSRTAIANGRQGPAEMSAFNVTNSVTQPDVQEITPNFLAMYTAPEQTILWIDSRRKVMEKWWPETTNYERRRNGWTSAGSYLTSCCAGGVVQTYLVDDGHHDRCAAVSEYGEDWVRYGDSGWSVLK